MIHYVYNVIPRATTQNAMKSNILRNSTDKSKWNSKKSSSSTLEGRKKRNEKQRTIRNKNMKCQTESSKISITTLSVNCLNLPIKKQIFKVSFKNDWAICCLQDTYSKYYIGRLKVKDRKRNAMQTLIKRRKKRLL